MPGYSVAQEVEDLAKPLIKGHHSHLDKVNIGYLFRDKAPISHNKVTYGMTSRVDDRNHVYSAKDVIIEISRDTWGLLSDELKKMLVDHELCHVGIVMNEDGTGIEADQHGRPKVFVKPHDFEDFHAVMDWYPEGRKGLQKITQGILTEIENAKKAAKAKRAAAKNKS